MPCKSKSLERVFTWNTSENKTETVTLVKPPKYKSIMIVGNTSIKNTKKFNWLEKKMWKYLFGVEIKDVKEEREEEDE